MLAICKLPQFQAVVSGQHYFGYCILCQIHMHAAGQLSTYNLDDKTINSEQVSDSFVIFTNCCSFKKEAVVSG